MTELLEQAIAQVRSMPEAEQDSVALLILAHAEKAKGIYNLSSEEKAAIRQGRAEAARGAFASDEEMEALWAEFER